MENAIRHNKTPEERKAALEEALRRVRRLFSDITSLSENGWSNLPTVPLTNRLKPATEKKP